MELLGTNLTEVRGLPVAGPKGVLLISQACLHCLQQLLVTLHVLPLAADFSGICSCKLECPVPSSIGLIFRLVFAL